MKDHNNTRVQKWIKSDSWIHLTVYLFMAYLFMQMSQSLGLKQYLYRFVAFLILSIPTQLFLLNREKLRSNNQKIYISLWLLSFIMIPLFIYINYGDLLAMPFLHSVRMGDILFKESFIVTSFASIVLESMLLLKDKFKKFRFKRKTEELDVFKLAFVSIAIIVSILPIMSHFFQLQIMNRNIVMVMLLYAYTVFQLFLIYFSYYFIFYIHHKFLFDKILKSKGLIYYFSGLVLLLMLFTPIHNYLISFFPVVKQLKLHTMGLTDNLFDDFNYSLTTLVLILSYPMIAVIEWYKKNTAINELQKQKSQAELSLLKQQINPHFFFNTLNNLYSMSLTQDKQTPDTILKLSDLMRYVIYKGKEEKVELYREVNYLRDYCDLQLIRMHKDVDFKFDIDIQNDSFEISPLLFIILIENAFKHGIEPAEGSCFLHIQLIQDDSGINFKCSNSKPKESKNGNGIGLKNLKRRLNILFEERYNLLINTEENKFDVRLTIEDE